jgi:hypothetical protein
VTSNIYMYMMEFEGGTLVAVLEEIWENNNKTDNKKIQ